MTTSGETVTRALSWGEAREAHEAGFEVRLRVADYCEQVDRFSETDEPVVVAGPDNELALYEREVWLLGGRFEVEEPAYPAGTIPTEQGAMILVDSEVARRVVGNDHLPWKYVGLWYSDEEMQRKVDECGFTRLVPESEVAAAREAGRVEGTREAEKIASEREESKPKLEGLTAAEAMAYDGPGRIFDRSGDEWDFQSPGGLRWTRYGEVLEPIFGPFRIELRDATEGGDDE